jgi:hypothetical protein
MTPERLRRTTHDAPHILRHVLIHRDHASWLLSLVSFLVSGPRTGGPRRYYRPHTRRCRVHRTGPRRSSRSATPRNNQHLRRERPQTPGGVPRAAAHKYFNLFGPVRPRAHSTAPGLSCCSASRRLRAHDASLPALSSVAAVHWPPCLPCVEGIYIASHLRAIAIVVYKEERRTVYRQLRAPPNAGDSTRPILNVRLLSGSVLTLPVVTALIL